MAMDRKEFKALATAIREHDEDTSTDGLCKVPFNQSQLLTLARFCEDQNPDFNWDKFIKAARGEE